MITDHSEIMFRWLVYSASRGILEVSLQDSWCMNIVLTTSSRLSLEVQRETNESLLLHDQRVGEVGQALGRDLLGALGVGQRSHGWVD